MPTALPSARINRSYWPGCGYLRARDLAADAEAAGIDLVDYLKAHAPDLLAEPETPITPAESILETCRRQNIQLRLDPDGVLTVGSPDGSGAWPSLRAALEAHVEAVAKLVAAGWHLRADAKALAA